MTSAKKLAKQRNKYRQRLIAVAVWAAGEKAKQDLGLPSEWYQGLWVKRAGCGTACCIAGKVALDSGAVPAVADGWGDWIHDPQQALERWLSDAYVDGDDTSLVVVPGEEDPVSVDAYAQERLGLTEGQATRLFNGDNSLPDVLRAIREALDQLDAADREAALATT